MVKLSSLWGAPSSRALAAISALFVAGSAYAGKPLEIVNNSNQTVDFCYVVQTAVSDGGNTPGFFQIWYARGWYKVKPFSSRKVTPRGTWKTVYVHAEVSGKSIQMNAPRHQFFAIRKPFTYHGLTRNGGGGKLIEPWKDGRMSGLYIMVAGKTLRSGYATGGNDPKTPGIGFDSDKVLLSHGFHIQEDFYRFHCDKPGGLKLTLP